MKNKFNKIIVLTILLVSIPILMASVSYNYSNYGRVIHSSPGYNYLTHVNQSILGVDYSEPRDLVVFNDEVYVIALSRELNRDVIIKLDKELEIIEVISEYSLTDEYDKKVTSKVTDAFDRLNEIYLNLFEDKAIYPGIRLPISDEDKLIKTADFSWEIGDEKVIQLDGTLKNNTENTVTSDLTLTTTLRGISETNTYSIEVTSLIEGVKGTGTLFNPTYETEENVSLDILNEILNFDFNLIQFSTIKDFIEFHENESELNDEDLFEFEYENYVVSFQNEEKEDSETKYKNIVFKTQDSEIEGFDNLHDSMFEELYVTNGARGLEVLENNIYIADSQKGRIIKLDKDYKVVDAFFGIDDESFKNVDYRPYKITVDVSGRMYVVAAGIFEGILELDADGSFNRYVGVNPIRMSALDVLKRFLMSEEQKQRTQKFLPTSYTNVTLNSKNFIYSTALPRENNSDDMIQLINPKGVDVLKRNGYHIPKGDIMYVQEKNNYVIEGPSELVDIAIGKGGIYSVLDAKRSRIFTYDSEGNLLYVNGDKGEQSDKFARGVALGYLGDDILVLDREGTIILYRPTEFGQKVNDAVYLHNEGKFEEASVLWEDVIKLNTNYEVAYKGIGRYHIREKNYKEAMKNFKIGHDQYYYSKAFVNYRNQLIKENFSLIFIGIIIIISTPFVISMIKKRRQNK